MPISIGRSSEKNATSATRRGTRVKKTSLKRRGSASNALGILNRMVGDDPELRNLIGHAEVNAQVAQLIYDARIDAGLTQAELAHLIGTHQPVIARLEDADYRGHSLAMLQRIAEALNRRLDIRFMPSSTGKRAMSRPTSGQPPATGTYR